MAGVDPNKEVITEREESLWAVYRRAIAEAVQRADAHAWHHAQAIEVAWLHRKKQPGEYRRLLEMSDIWSVAPNYGELLPSIEIKASIVSVMRDHENVPILIPIDPWYKATVSGDELNAWMSRTGLESRYRFRDYQTVTVVTLEENWNSQEDRRESMLSEDAADVEDPSSSAVQVVPDATERPLGTRERNILLCLLGALCKEAKIDYTKPAKAAGYVKNMVDRMGLSIGESTIEGHLKRISDALETRMK